MVVVLVVGGEVGGGRVVVAGRGCHTARLYAGSEGGIISHSLKDAGSPAQGMGSILAHGCTGLCKGLGRGAQGVGARGAWGGWLCCGSGGGGGKVGRVHGSPPCCQEHHCFQGHGTLGLVTTGVRALGAWRHKPAPAWGGRAAPSPTTALTDGPSRCAQPKVAPHSRLGALQTTGVVQGGVQKGENGQELVVEAVVRCGVGSLR